MALMPLPYNPALFVGRQDKIDQVLDIVVTLLAGKAPSTRTLIFTGQRGSGKTWLLHHLKKRFEDELKDRVRAIFVDLENWQTVAEPEKFVREVMAAFAQQLPAEAGQVTEEEKFAVPLRRWTEWLVQDVRKWVGQGEIVILLLDSVYETAPETLELLEQSLLAPLAVEKGVLILMAGRGFPPFWHAPELGVYSEELKLEPFAEADSKALLAKASVDDPQRIRRVIELSGGYPYLLWALGCAKPEKDTETLKAALDYMLQPVLKDPETWQRWQSAAVLEVFDEDRLAKLSGSDLAAAKDFLDTLLETNLAWYKKERRGYVLDAAIHQVWEQVIRLSNPNDWKALHQQAVQLYLNWAKQFQTTAAIWEERARYHEEQILKEAGNA